MFTTISEDRSYMHRVQYHETDAMKIVHHAQYVLWMEEARNDFFTRSGFDWSTMEKETGIMIPVLFQSVEYKAMVRFGDMLAIKSEMTKFDGIKMDFLYCILDRSSGETKAVGTTKHGFIGSDYRPVMLQREYPDGYERLREAYEKQK